MLAAWPRVSLLYIWNERIAPMTDFPVKKKDEEVEEVECGHQRKWKNPLLSILRRLEPEDCEQKAKRTSVGDIR